MMKVGFLFLPSAGLPRTTERSPNSWCSSEKCRISGKKSPAGVWFSGWEQPFLEGLWAQSYPYNVPAKLFVTYWQGGRNTKLRSRLGTWLISVLPWISWVILGTWQPLLLFALQACSVLCCIVGITDLLFPRRAERCCSCFSGALKLAAHSASAYQG